jgi:O-acetyl-ADP-ribose deacetylase (regulator of RNase III)
VDVIIGSSSSANLMRAIFEAAGDDVQQAYNLECQNNSHAILISTVPGDLPCKRIFFLEWKPDRNEEKLRQSLVDRIWMAMQHLIQYNFTSIAFPAIGCGEHGCSIDLIVKTLVKELKHQLIIRNLPLTVKFIIQSNQQNIYDEFCKQVLTTQNGMFSFFLSSDHEDRFQENCFSSTDVPESLNHQLPSTWEKSIENKIRFVLPMTSDEYKSVFTNFQQTMNGQYTTIIQIERIQNERWYAQYLAHSRDFQKRHKIDTEKRLYHGCPETAVNLIIDDCFNRSFAGKNGKFCFNVLLHRYIICL